MTNPLHHTIRNRTSARILLCRQWCERIEFESFELALNGQQAEDDKAQLNAVADFQLWFSRLHEDVDIARKRLRQDGYAPHGICYRGEPINLEPGDWQALPVIPDSAKEAFWVNSIQLWRKAVQS